MPEGRAGKEGDLRIECVVFNRGIGRRDCLATDDAVSIGLTIPDNSNGITDLQLVQIVKCPSWSSVGETMREEYGIATFVRGTATRPAPNTSVEYVEPITFWALKRLLVKHHGWDDELIGLRYCRSCLFIGPGGWLLDKLLKVLSPVGVVCIPPVSYLRQ